MTVHTTYGDITATKELLDQLSDFLNDAGEENKREGFLGLAEMANTMAIDIIEALLNTGYYGKRD